MVKVPEKYTKFGPGQIETALSCLGFAALLTNKEVIAKPSHKHSFSKIFFEAFSNSIGSVTVSSNCLSFKFLYCLDAVQILCSVNSLSKVKIFFLQGLPGLFFSILSFNNRSADEFLKLFNGTPKGEAVLK